MRPQILAPGPFAFADSRYVEQILQNAGFSEIRIKAHEESLKVAETLAEAVQFQTRVGPAARVMAELEGDQRARALAAVEDALRPFDGEAACISTRQFGSSAPRLRPLGHVSVALGLALNLPRARLQRL